MNNIKSKTIVLNGSNPKVKKLLEILRRRKEEQREKLRNMKEEDFTKIIKLD